MPERLEADGTLRVTLLGDLDPNVAERLSVRLDELKALGAPVRSDLSRLGFIDCSGPQALSLPGAIRSVDLGGARRTEAR